MLRPWLAWLALGAAACSHAGAAGDPSSNAVTLPSPDVDHPRWKTPASSYQPERNLCVDRELTRRNLNEFGDARGTTYEQGAPQGVATTRDRYEYVLKRQPEIAATCTRTPDELER